MRNILAVALGLVLLISAISAAGSENLAIVDVTTYLSDNSISGAGIAQMSELEANLMGNELEAMQTMISLGSNNLLVGSGSDETFLMQMGIEKINDTGCGNLDLQTEAIIATENCVTIGNINQISLESVDVQGNDNFVNQNSLNAPMGNSLTDSELGLASAVCTAVEGSGNGVVQNSLQTSVQNCLTGSQFLGSASLNSDIAACNNLGPDEYNSNQLIIETSAINSLTYSGATQSGSLNTQDTGTGNLVNQVGNIGLFTNCIDDGVVLQNINADAISLGCNNQIVHNLDMQTFDNYLTNGIAVQDISIATSE